MDMENGGVYTPVPLITILAIATLTVVLNKGENGSIDRNTVLYGHHYTVSCQTTQHQHGNYSPKRREKRAGSLDSPHLTNNFLQQTTFVLDIVGLVLDTVRRKRIRE